MFEGVIIPGALILIAAVILNIFIYQLEFAFFKSIYDREIEEIESLITRRFQSALIVAESTRSFFVSSREVSKEEFDLFSSTLVRNVSAGTIALPVTIEQIDPNNNIRYVYPMNEDNAKIVGVDLNKYPNRLSPIIKAKETRLPVVTEPIILQQGYPGLLIYDPIFEKDEYLGEVVVVVRLSELLASNTGKPIYYKDSYILTDNSFISIDDDMIFNSAGDRIIDPQGDTVKDPISAEYFPFKKGTVSKNIVFADKEWQFKFSPIYIDEVNKRIAIYIGISVSFMIAIIGFLYVLQKRRDQLSEEKARVDALFMSAGEGLVACDQNEIITYANKQSESISGYSVEESIGKSYFDLWRLYDSKGNAIPVKERLITIASAKKEVVRISTSDHLYILRKDGKRLPISSTISPVIVGDRIYGTVISFMDITKESEIDKMKTEFLSLASHQLLTPSTAVKWISEMMLEGDFGPLNEKQREKMEDIYESNRRMNSLINSLLNISRIESGRIIVAPKLTRVNTLAENIIKELKGKIEEKGHSLKIDFEEDLPEINIDPNLIGEVYKNILANAIKYTPEKGSISVTIKKEGNDIVSKISDNGYGIPENGKKRMFEKFYRGENIVSIDQDGNGLGLYLVKQLIDVSGGKIWFESEEGKGTTFWFSLPVSGSAPKAGEVSIS